MIEDLRDSYRIPRSRLERAGEFSRQAAVLLALTDEPEPQIILTRRADHLSTHSGEVSFPGGKWEAGDASLVATALRESEEETGLPAQQVDVINVEPHVYSLWGIRVTPFVGIVPGGLELRPNLGELDAVFQVPLQFFLADRRSRTDVYHNGGKEWWSPVYHFSGYKIWGLTARILVQFLNNALAAGIERDNAAPESARRPRPISFD